MIRKYIEKIGESKEVSKMNELGDMLVELVEGLEESHPEEYKKYSSELYEMAYGKKVTKDMAIEWVSDMKPVGEHWTIEDTTGAKESLGYDLDNVDFYVVANMIYNDYNDLVRDNEELALKMAYDWLHDEDAKDNKLYCYWKHIVKSE